MRWCESYRADPRARPLADRHYNRQKVGAAQFVPPGACLVLLTAAADSLWITSWPKSEFVQHRWAGAWVNSLFRREGPGLASAMIREAVAATRWRWPDVPPLGLITFVDASKVRGTNPGCCYKAAGFVAEGQTKGGLLAFRLRPEDMPEAEAPALRQLEIGAA